MSSNIRAKDILEIVGVIAVVTSLIFVGYQLAQSNTIATRDARAEIVANAININGYLLENPELAELMVKHRNTNPTIAPVESEQSNNIAELWFQDWASTVVAYDSGYLPEGIYQGYISNAESKVIQYPGMIPYIEDALSKRGINTDNTFGFGVFKAVLDQIDAQYEQ